MYSLILSTLLSLPAYPLNPVVQDTLNSVNLHLTAGFNSPNSIVESGFEFTLKTEWLVSHPFVVRAAFEYKYGKVNSLQYPDGNVRTFTFSSDVIYYRGTDKLTGYLGLGPVYVVSNYNLSGAAEQLIYKGDILTEVRIKDSFGYRLTLGLRFRKSYSLEMAATEVKTNFIITNQIDAARFSESATRVRIGDVRVTLGYLIDFTIF